MDTITLLESLRDFFYYGKQEELRQAYRQLAAAEGITEDTAIDWEQEEFTFNRLFVGPMAPLAPAIASVYLDPEGLVQGGVTADVRAFYANIGLSLPEVGREPEDSLAYELDACRHLLLAAEEVPEAREAYGSFVSDHLSAWIPEFTTTALAHCPDSVAIRDALALLAAWVADEQAKLTSNKEME